jgi:hypothetical protein
LLSRKKLPRITENKKVYCIYNKLHQMISSPTDRDPFVKIAGSGSYIPGEAIPVDKIDLYLGEITDAPQRSGRWLERIRPLMKELLDIQYYHFAIDPITRQFTEDNITMSVKAAQQALTDAKMEASEIDLIFMEVPTRTRCQQHRYGYRKD